MRCGTGTKPIWRAAAAARPGQSSWSGALKLRRWAETQSMVIFLKTSFLLLFAPFLFSCPLDSPLNLIVPCLKSVS